MSGTRDRLDLDELVARIELQQAETRKFAVELHKLMREAEKFRAEEIKLWRDWRLAPWVVGLTVLSAIIGGLIARHL
jgi:hypothetical protein